MMKVDLVLMERFDSVMPGSGAQDGGEGSGEFAAILNQASAGAVKAEPKTGSPDETVLETTAEARPARAEEILSADSEEMADQLLGDARVLGMPMQQTENNSLMIANEDVVAALPASAGDGIQGEAANSDDNQKPVVVLPKIVGEIVFASKINPEAEAKAVGQVNLEAEAGLPKTQTETKASSTADLAAASTNVDAKAGKPASGDLPHKTVIENQPKAADTVEKQGLPAGNPQLVSDNGSDTAIDREVVAVLTKPPLSQTGLEAAQGQGDVEKAANPGSGQERVQSAVPAPDSQGSPFQQPAVQGDQAVRSDSILQPQQSANLRESVMQQVEGRLIYLRESGVNPAEMRLTLHPPELGEVTVRVFSRQGKLSASIIAESSLVKEILESSIAELKQRMNFVHIQFEQLDLSTAGKQSGGSDRPGEGSGFGERASGERDSLQFGEDGQPVLSNAPPDQINGGIDYWA